MKYDSNFKNDLEFGQKAENHTVNILRQKYPKATLKKGYHKEYDIEIPELNQTAEVKYDKQTEYTGNLYIECESRGKESGIKTTKANWLFYWWDNLDKKVIIEYSDLRKIIQENNFRKVAGGDSNTSMGYLIPVKYFEER